MYFVRSIQISWINKNQWYSQYHHLCWNDSKLARDSIFSLTAPLEGSAIHSARSALWALARSYGSQLHEHHGSESHKPMGYSHPGLTWDGLKWPIRQRFFNTWWSWDILSVLPCDESLWRKLYRYDSVRRRKWRKSTRLWHSGRI